MTETQRPQCTAGSIIGEALEPDARMRLSSVSCEAHSLVSGISPDVLLTALPLSISEWSP